jgi:hypothetical protein
MAAYGARPVKRQRRTSAELATIKDEMVRIVADDHPLTLRGLFYRLAGLGDAGEDVALSRMELAG